MACPTASTVKRLFALSGNCCAFPQCPQQLVVSGVVTGEICHIRAQSPGGPRFDPNQTDAERHAFENLVLMCGAHHRQIDQDPSAFPTARLQEIKRNHEARSGSEAVITDDEVIAFIVKINGPIIASLGQTGGQTAHSIVNMYGDTDAGARLSPDRWTLERMFAGARSMVVDNCEGANGSVSFRIQPLVSPPSVVPSVATLAAAVRAARQDFGFGFPYVADDSVERHQSMGKTFVAKTTGIHPYIETWIAFESGYFQLSRVILEDARRETTEGHAPGTYLNWIRAMAIIQEFLLFSSVFLTKIGFAGDFEYNVGLVGMNGRVLADAKSSLHWAYRCDSQTIDVSGRTSTVGVASSPIADGIFIARRIFEMFSWDNPDEEDLRSRFDQIRKRQI